MHGQVFHCNTSDIDHSLACGDCLHQQAMLGDGLRRWDGCVREGWGRFGDLAIERGMIGDSSGRHDSRENVSEDNTRLNPTVYIGLHCGCIPLKIEMPDARNRS